MAAPNTRQAILDAAERVFSMHGFEGGSMSRIAKQAGVAQALLHYHFQNKENLFEVMFARRAGAINLERAKSLDRLFEGQDLPSLEQLVEVLFRPTVAFGHEGQAGNYFARIVASAANTNDPHSCDLIERHYDPIALRFIDAFQKIVPNLRRDQAVWAYLFAIGVGMNMMAATGRAQRLSDNLCDDRDVNTLLDQLIPYVSAGIRALVGLEAAPSGSTINEHQANKRTS